jgi:hypothetical protein
MYGVRDATLTQGREQDNNKSSFHGHVSAIEILNLDV